MSAPPPIQDLLHEHEMAIAATRRVAETAQKLDPVPVRSAQDSADDSQDALALQIHCRAELERFHTHLRALRDVLLLHFRKEEEGLFPGVREMVSAGAPRMDILAAFFAEHSDDDLRAHTLLRAGLRQMGDLATEVESGQDPADAALRLRAAAQFAEGLLDRHASKEATLIFPMIERLLDEAQMAAVAERMRAIEASYRAMSPKQ